MLRVENQLDPGVRQWLGLKVQLLQRGKLEETDADIYGMCRQRLQQLIGTQHRYPIIQLRVTLTDVL
ncbi:hypothetical protein D3C87_2069870 [compost metagenome]